MGVWHVVMEIYKYTHAPSLTPHTHYTHYTHAHLKYLSSCQFLQAWLLFIAPSMSTGTLEVTYLWLNSLGLGSRGVLVTSSGGL